jgi:hypothetical protein
VVSLGLLDVRTAELSVCLLLQVESQANITEVHEPLAFDGRYAEGADARRGRRGAGEEAHVGREGTLGEGGGRGLGGKLEV